MSDHQAKMIKKVLKEHCSWNTY